MPCPMCKTAERQDKRCPNCGLFIVSDTEMDLIYGTSFRQRVTVRFSFTDRYLIIHRLKGLEKSTGGFGVLGGAIVSAVTLTVKESKLPYGYYGLNELKEVIYPYRNKKFKKNKAIKFVFKDGSDFIVKDIFEDNLLLISKCLPKLGIPVVDGSNVDNGEVFCKKPFVTEDTVGLRVCSTAAGFIKMFPENFSVEPIIKTGSLEQTVNAQPQFQSQSQSQPQPQPSVQPQPTSEPMQSRRIFMVAELELRVKTYNNLRRAGISEIDDLTTRTREELMNCGMGDDEIGEIETRLSVYNLCLAGGTVHRAQPTESNTATQVPPQQEQEAKFCRMCGAKIRRSDLFCLECGADQR